MSALLAAVASGVPLWSSRNSLRTWASVTIAPLPSQAGASLGARQTRANWAETAGSSSCRWPGKVIDALHADRVDAIYGTKGESPSLARVPAEGLQSGNKVEVA